MWLTEKSLGNKALFYFCLIEIQQDFVLLHFKIEISIL